MVIEDMKTCYQNNPLGIDLSCLTFTWKVKETEGTKQTQSRLQIAADREFEKILFDSDRDDAERGGILPSYAYTPVFKAKPAITYYWKIAVQDNAGETAESAVQTFEGGHPEGSWKGVWITPAFTAELHPVFRTTFQLTKKEAYSLKKARLYICGLGLYEAYINGRKVGNQFLTPYFTDYRYWIQYQSYDVGPYLREGENTLDVWLGNGWYKGRFGYLANGQLRCYYGDSFKLLADMYITCGGEEKVITTDESWDCLKSPVVLSGIYDGEVYDARIIETLEEPSFRDISKAQSAPAPQGTLSPMTGVPVTAHERRKPEKLIYTPSGETVLDFGQEITGWTEFDSDTPRDNEITLEYGEVLQNGNFYRDNLRTATAKYTYISRGKGREHARPHFTFYGFRYVKVTGVEMTEDILKDFEAVSIYSDIEETGSIITGNAKVNRLIENTKWSQKDNFLDIPSDCPQRDERLGWTGDAEIFAGTASYHMETAQFFRKYLKDMALEQQEKHGAVPYVVPDVLTVGREKMAEPPFDMTEDLWGEAGASAWGDAATIIPWQCWLHFRNRKLLAEEYSNMKQWTDFIRYMDETYCGGKRLWTCGFHFGDWLSLDVEGDTAGMNHREGGTDKYFVASAYYMYSALLTSKAAGILGKNEEEEFYRKLSDEVMQALREKYVTGEGTLSINTQTAYVLGIHFGIFEGESALQAAGDHLAELLAEWNDHLATGFVGTAYICDALTVTGHFREACTLLLNEDYPSWLYEVNLGATTIWERWNSILPDGSISGTGMNSLNHYAYGSVCGWIYEDICGLKVTEETAAGEPMVIAPHTDVRLGMAKASVHLNQGVYTSGWKYGREGGEVIYRFTVPFDGKAVFRPDLELTDITLNGERISQADLAERGFERGIYTIRGKRTV